MSEYDLLIAFAFRLAFVAVVTSVLVSAVVGVTVLPWVILSMLRGISRRLENIEDVMFGGFDYDPNPPAGEEDAPSISNSAGEDISKGAVVLGIHGGRRKISS